LKLKHYELLSNVAFNCNLRHYTLAAAAHAPGGFALYVGAWVVVRGLGGAVQVDPESTLLGFNALN